MPFVSVIVPVYRTEQDLPACIESILSQTFTDWELLLVDDGSPDRCGEICDSYAQKDARVRVIHQANQGVSAARNNAMAVAQGDWLCFVDADDTVAPFALELLARYHSLADVLEFPVSVGKGIVYAPEIKTEMMEPRELLERQVKIIEGAVGKVYAKDLRMAWTSAWSKFYSRRLIEEQAIAFPVGMKRAEDIVFNLRVLAARPRVALVHQPFYRYRMSASSVTLAFNPEEEALLALRRTQFCQFIEQYHPQEDVFQHALDQFAVTLVSSCLIRCFCHPDNPASYAVRKRAFLACIRQPAVQRGLQTAKLSSMNTRDRVLGSLTRMRLFWLADVLVKCYLFLRRHAIVKNV